MSVKRVPSKKVALLYADTLPLHALGDDFKDPSLPGWTLGGGMVAGDITAAITEPYDAACCNVVFSAGARRLLKDIPSGDFDQILTIHGVTQIRRAMGLFLADASGNGVCATIYDNSNGLVLWDMTAWALTAGSQVGAVVSPITGWNASNMPVVVKLRKVTGTVTAYLSFDGGLTYQSQAFSKTTTGYAKVGIAACNGAGGNATSALRIGRYNIV